MDDARIAHFRQRLELLRDELAQPDEVSDEAARSVQLDQQSVGRLSRMDAMQGQAMALAGRRRREIGLRRVLAALRRIEHGEYGDCTDCGEPIDSRRLEVDPAIALCLQCAARNEG